ncbi:MAG: hypothetical protein JWP41_2281, partial [Ramlibacter sp.]|nr:hypothetical protein [Ramlibacter sp.]
AMDFRRAHPLAFASLAALAVALALPFAAFELRFTPRAALGVALLGSAFAVLSAGHFLVRGSWRSHLVLALANGPLLFAWWFAVAATWYFAPGLLGAAVLGLLLAVPAVFLVYIVRRTGRGAASAV